MSPTSPASSHGSHSPISGAPHESLDVIRKRVRKACDRCRMKKTKCDGSNPCSRCKTDNVICCSKEGQKLRRRNFPKGYAEMLEKQHNQLVLGLQRMYQRLQKASLWDGEPLDESSGRPLTHDILAAMGLLEPTQGGDASGAFERFIEQPHADEMQQEPSRGIEITPPESSPELSQRNLNDNAMFGTMESSAYVAKSRSMSIPISPMTPNPPQPPRQAEKPYPHLENLPSEPLSAISPPIQLDALWNDPLYCFDEPQPSSIDSVFNNDGWCSPATTMLPPLTTQLPQLQHDAMSNHRRTASAPRPALSNNWLGNGVGFDSSDFMTDFHQLSRHDTLNFDLRLPSKVVGLP